MNEISENADSDYSMHLANSMEKVLNFSEKRNLSKNDITTLIVIQSFVQNITKSLFVNLGSSKFNSE